MAADHAVHHARAGHMLAGHNWNLETSDSENKLPL